MQEMISTGLKRYAGKDLKIGARFEVDDKDVRTLKLSRLAKEASPKKDLSADKGGSYLTRDMAAGTGGSRTTKKHDQTPPQ